jgi:SlyX protein
VHTGRFHKPADRAIRHGDADQAPEFRSNSGMEHPNDIEQRLTDLEIKATFTEDLLDQLDQVIVRQQQQIDALIREIARLRQPATDASVGESRNLRDELPPHY